MGDWSDYFEDFPEENPANQVDGHYHPNGAAINMARAAARAKQENEQAALDAEIKLIIEKHSKRKVEEKPAGLTIAKLKYLDKLHERAEELAGYLLSRLSSTPNDQRLERISERACARAERRNQASIRAWQESDCWEK
ncbi:hypothetical protein JWZ98_05915 [Methylomonas sp. EFPC1]|uniref:hypothetical protein n=1 Tax=Methylomonas sp. EFPC1 TaxID=2812647 RepID=UPI001967C334|nr:hypothetical protein [Methylomonas sp. EFPC1]QSB02476.1 hypothetical protein JWZ98_05915 [Methylomonas sp. EFPC1]